MGLAVDIETAYATFAVRAHPGTPLRARVLPTARIGGGLMTPAPLRDTHDAPPETDAWDDWYGGATPEEVAEVYRARGWAWGTTVRTGRTWI